MCAGKGRQGTTTDSEAIVIVRDGTFDLFESLEVLKDAVLEDSVELVFDRSQDSVLLVNI